MALSEFGQRFLNERVNWPGLMEALFFGRMEPMHSGREGTPVKPFPALGPELISR